MRMSSAMRGSRWIGCSNCKMPNMKTLHLNMFVRLILAASGGVLYFLAFVGFEQWYLAWICLVPLLFAIDGLSPWRAFLVGWLFGTVALTGGFYWVAYTIHVFAFMPWIISGIGCLLLCIAQATEFAAFCLAYAWLRRRTSATPLLLATVAFVSAEFLSPQLFPHYFGNSQYLWVALIQVCDMTGVLGVTALIVFVNAAIYIMIRNFMTERRLCWRLGLSVAAVVAIVIGYGYLKVQAVDAEMADRPKVRFGIAQANMGIYEKKRDPQKAIRISQEMSRQLKGQGAEIIIWPETAVQAPVLDYDAKRLPDGVVGSIDIPILTGALSRDYGRSGHPLYNIAILADEHGDIIGSYVKQKLLMFGEYIPLGDTFPSIYRMFPYISRFAAGHSNAPLKFRDYLMSVNICYEEILPRLMNGMMEGGPNVIVNITNDNWFGRTHEPVQHLALAAFRAVEHRRWLVRSTNTGISAFVDAAGRIVGRSPLMEPATLIADVPMMRGDTVYARYGDWFAGLSLLAMALLGIRAAGRH